MRTFHHHPDNIIYIRDGATLYAASVPEFEADIATLGATPYAGLPEGMRERRFDGQRHVLLSADSQFAGEDPWHAGAQYLLHMPDLLAAKAIREHPEPTIEELRARKNAEINQARAVAKGTSFPFAGKEIACDLLSRSDIDGVSSYVSLHGALPPDFPGAWKAVDNTLVPIPDVETFMQMVAAMVATGTAQFLHAQQLKVELAAAVTAEEIAAIRW